MELGPRQKMWVDELKSGKYNQGRSRLNYDNKDFCCLGIACDIFYEEVGIEKIKTDRGEYSYGESTCILPIPVMEYLGMYNDLGSVRNDPSIGLSHLNDSGYSFENIAEMIENYPEFYFKESK